MKTKTLLPLLLYLVLYFPVRSQFCWVEAIAQNPAMPYVCNQDSFKFNLYTSGMQMDSIYIYWGDNTADTLKSTQLQFFTSVAHKYNATGVYYPYFRVFSAMCYDTIIEFKIYGVLHPGSQDSISSGHYNYVIVIDSCTNVTGRVYVDEDNSCTFNAGDQPMNAQQVVAMNGNQITGSTFTDAMGNYSFHVPQSHTIHLLPFNNQISVLQPVCGTSLNNNKFEPNNLNHFVFNCPSGTDVSINATTSLFAQTVDRWLCFTLQNKSCNPYFNATVTFHIDNRILVNTSQSVTVSYYSYNTVNNQQFMPVVSGNTVSLSGIYLASLGYASGCIPVRADPLLTTLGDTICYTATVTPTTGDVNPQNNADTVCAVVVTSYDPNDKAGVTNGRSAHGIVQPNEDVIYTLRFQNTGNFPAKDVRLVDTIDSKLNIYSIEVLSHTHPMIVQKSGNVVTFFFNDIWLPDSASNEPASHGQVVYRIKQQPNLPPFATFKNFVDIYFDYNPPVRTNVVVSTIEGPAGLTGSTVSYETLLYPNPASDKLYISTKRYDAYSVKIYDIAGQLAAEKQFYGTFYEWDRQHLPGGMYLVEVTSPQHREILKLILH